MRTKNRFYIECVFVDHISRKMFCSKCLAFFYGIGIRRDVSEMTFSSRPVLLSCYMFDSGEQIIFRFYDRSQKSSASS